MTKSVFHDAYMKAIYSQAEWIACLKRVDDVMIKDKTSLLSKIDPFFVILLKL